MAAPSTCDCVTPDELADMTCGACHRPRIGDDLDREQFHLLTLELIRVLFAPDRHAAGLRRVRGRKRPSVLQHIGDSA